ncbi:MAG TPA: hypothetical protein VIM65_20620 [Cyclobacteriaceae bacterium]
MTHFNIVKYVGESNQITKFGKQYVSLPCIKDPKMVVIYAEYQEGKLPKFSKEGVSRERKSDLFLVKPVEYDHVTECNNIISAAPGFTEIV